MSAAETRLECLYRELLVAHETCDKTRRTFRRTILADQCTLLENATDALRRLITFVLDYRRTHNLEPTTNVCAGEVHWHWWIMADARVTDLREVAALALTESMLPTAYAEVNLVEDAILRYALRTVARRCAH